MPKNSVPASTSSVTDPLGLHETLRRNVRGDVRFDNGSRALYATDGSNYRQVPIGVVLPRDADDVEAAISVCRDFGAPLLCRGGGTSLSGQCCNVAVVLDFTRYMFSARLYKLCAQKVGVPDYKDLVQEKLHTAEDLYRFMIDQFNQSRAFVLELMVVVILIIELIYFFKGHPL